MPYENDYNKMVADDVMKLNKKYIDHEKMTGQGLSGGFLGALAGMLLPTIVNKIIGNGMPDCDCDDVAECVCGDARKEGGSGFSSGTFMDTGFDRTVGAGMSAGVAKYVKKKSKMGCGKSGAGGSGAGRSGAGGSGAGRSGGKKKEGMLLESKVGGVKKRGRPSKMKGGAELGVPVSLAGEGKRKKGGALVPKANMKSSSMAGMGRSGGKKAKGTNKRAEIVRKVMNEKGMSMIEASKYVKEHNLY